MDGPYYGQISRLDGSSSGVWVPMAIKNGGLHYHIPLITPEEMLEEKYIVIAMSPVLVAVQE